MMVKKGNYTTLERQQKEDEFFTKYTIMTRVFLWQTILMISMGFPMTVTEMMGTKKTRKRRMMLLWKPCKNGPRNPTAQHFDPNTAIVLENTNRNNQQSASSNTNGHVYKKHFQNEKGSLDY